MKKLIIFGLGDMGRVANFYFTNDSEYEVAAFTVNKDFLEDDNFEGLPVVAFEDIVEHYNPSDYDMYIAVGYKNLNKERAKLYDEAKAKGYKLATYVSSKATVWTKDIGENTFILEDNTIQPFVKIGNNVILWSGNHVGHDVVIKDHCFVTSHVVLSGRVELGEYCFMGVNSTVRDQVKIAEECLIAAGALIVKDTDAKGVYKMNSKAEKSNITSDKLARI